MRRFRNLNTARIISTSLLVSTVLVALAGCGDGKIARYPVKGTIRVDGQPVEGALVIFCPVSGPPELQKERPYGRTDAQGIYELRTFEPGDGAPVGDYKVMVRWMGGGQSQSRGSDDQTGGGDRLRGRYVNPETSGLTYTVIEGDNDVPPFELKTR
jgi:hypothetical protein